MDTEPRIELEGAGRRRLELGFSAGRVSRDGGGVHLRQVDDRAEMASAGGIWSRWLHGWIDGDGSAEREAQSYEGREPIPHGRIAGKSFTLAV